MASAEPTAIKKAMLRAKKAESEIIEYRSRFTQKYGIDQTEVIQQLTDLKASLIEDEKQLIINSQIIHRNEQILKQSYTEIHSLKESLIRQDQIDGEDFRLMMRKYFQSLKVQCLSIKKMLSTEQLWEKVIAPNYKLSTEQLRNIRNMFVRDMRFRLSKNKNKNNRSSLHMSPSFIDSIPTSNASSTCYTINWDLRDSNVRMFRFGFNGHPHFLKKSQMKPSFEINKENAHSLQLFDDLALRFRAYILDKFANDIRKTREYHLDDDGNIIKIPLEEVDDDDDDDIDHYLHNHNHQRRKKKEAADNKPQKNDYRFSMGLSLGGWPIQQSKINEAILTEWSKDFNIPDVVGQDIVKLMQDSLDKYNIPVRIDAVCTEAVGILMSGAFDRNSTRISLSLHKHSSAAYMEPKKGKQVLSVEWDSFNPSLPRQPSTDYVMDSYTINKGKGYMDKMIGAEYLGELVRLLALDVFGAKIERYGEKTVLNQRWGLDTHAIAVILDQFDSQNMQDIYKILRMDLGLQEFSSEDGKLFVQLCRVIVNRSADLASALLLALAERTGVFTKIKDKELFILNVDMKKKCFVAVDGFVWSKIPRYQQRVRNTMMTIVNKKIADRIKFSTQNIGAAKGAAIVCLLQNS